MAQQGAGFRSRAITIGAVAMATIAALGITGCMPGFSSDDDTTGKDDESTGAKRAMTFDLSAKNTTPVEVGIPEEPVATSPTDTPDMEFELYALQRSGKTVNVAFAMHNTGDQEVERGDANRNLDESPGAVSRQASNVSLTDAANLKDYRAFVGGDPTDVNNDQCLCSTVYRVGAGEDYAPRERQYFMTQVAAPPADVQTVTVQAGVAALPDQTIEG